MDARWRIRLLGGWSVDRETAEAHGSPAGAPPVRLPTRKTELLLAYLACFPEREHRREHLVRLFWPESGPEAGRKSLSTALSALRRALEPSPAEAGSVLISDRLRVSLRAGAVRTDLAALRSALKSAAAADPGETPGSTTRLHRLEAAVAAYTGPLLPGHGAPWLETERQALQREVCAALNDVVRHRAARGDAEQALRFARRLVDLEPLNEAAQRQVIELLVARGEVAAALRQFRGLEDRLARELGTAPSAATRELILNARAGSGGLPPRRPAAIAGEPPVREPGARSRAPRGRGTGMRAGVAPRRQAAPPAAAAHGSNRIASVSPAARPLPTPPPAATSGPAPARGGLPLPATRFIGRAAERARLAAMLTPADPALAAGFTPETRLVTLTGPGGSGKSRLAVEVATDLAAEAAVWFVPLADLDDPARLPDRIAQVVCPRGDAGLPLLERVIAAVGDRPALLILDNFEHLLAPAGAVRGSESPNAPAGERAGHQPEPPGMNPALAAVREVIGRTPMLTCLVTSRQRLNLAGEREVLVPPLPLPAPATAPRTPEEDESRAPAGDRRAVRGRPGSLPGTLRADVERNECVQLFVDRAAAVVPGFRLTDENAAAVGELCAGLDGLPLAIELAAARAQVLSPAQMLARLRQRGSADRTFLQSRQRDVPERHRTMEAVVEWSYRLLPPDLRQLLNRLSVFRGGCTLEAVQALAAAEDLEGEAASAGGRAGRREESPPGPAGSRVGTQLVLLDGMAQLRECSLIASEPRGGQIRFYLLEGVRQFAAAQLSASERAGLGLRHASYYCELLREMFRHTHGPDQAECLRRMDQEHGNFWAALEHCRASGNTHLGLCILVNLAVLWEVQGLYRQGFEYFTQFLARAAAADSGVPRDVRLATALTLAGAFAHMLGENDIACRYSESGLELARELGETRAITHALSCRAGIAYHQDDVAAARALYEESAALKQASGDPMGLAGALGRLGTIAYFEGDFARARSLHQESLDLSTRAGDRRCQASALDHLGFVAREQGEFTLARQAHEEALAIRREMKEQAGIALSLHHLARLAIAERDLAAAARLLEESQAVREAIGDRRGLGAGLEDLGRIAIHRGEFASARARLEASLAIRRQLRERRAVADLIDLFGVLMGASSRAERAAEILGAADALRDRAGYRRLPSQADEVERALSLARASLDPPRFASAWSRGRRWSLDDAVAASLEP